jgi:hypothetical protein
LIFNVGSFVMVLSATLRKRSIRYDEPWKIVAVSPHNLYQCVGEYGRSATYHISSLLLAFIPRSSPLSFEGTVEGNGI